MSNYVVCVRDIVNGQFNNEPGKTCFLEIPSHEDNMKVSNRIAKKSTWVKSVLKNAVVKSDDGSEYGGILVFIHGYNQRQDMVLERHKQIKTSLKKEGFKGEIVSFD